MKQLKKWTALLCAVMMAMTMVVIPPVETTYAETLAELNNKLAQANANKAKIEAQIAAIKNDDDFEGAMEKKKLLDRRNSILQEQINLVQEEVKVLTKQIEENEAEEARQYELFCKQVRQEEERGPVSYWSVIFKATGFADLLSRMDFINEIMEYEQGLINSLRELRAQLTADKDELKVQEADLLVRQDELEKELAAADAIIAKYEDEIQGLKQLIAEEDRIADEASEEIKKYHQNNGGSDGGTQGVLSGLIWPTDCRYITSKFGPRNTGIPGASTNHKGVDIGAARKTNIFAAQSGTVIQSGWYGGYGYCVTIDHGSGVTTLYGHMYQSPYVRVGQSVSRGQVIGLCGSTGVSSGAHIHYELRLDGTPIDPITYLPGYILV